MSVNGTNPATLFGGTWERLKDRFLLAAGDTYAAGSTGGEASHTLTTAEMPSHTHGRGSMNITGNIYSVLPWQNNGNITEKHGAFTWITSANGEYINSSWANDNTGHRRPADLIFNAADAWTGNTSSVGSGKAHNNLPPYLTVYMWKRTA